MIRAFLFIQKPERYQYIGTFSSINFTDINITKMKSGYIIVIGTCYILLQVGTRKHHRVKYKCIKITQISRTTRNMGLWNRLLNFHVDKERSTKLHCMYVACGNDNCINYTQPCISRENFRDEWQITRDSNYHLLL